jgi:O-antigen/teichoic acid export membrane protein
MCLLLLTGLPILLCAKFGLNLWAGTAYGTVATPILQMLIVANIVRLAGTPYSVILLGTGQQHLATASPLMEGVTNLIVSIVAGYYLGAIGVAFGTLVGAVVGLLAHVFYNLPRTRTIQCQRHALVREGLLLPLVCSLPLLTAAVALRVVYLPVLIQLTVVAAATILTLLSMAHWGNLLRDLRAARS